MEDTRELPPPTVEAAEIEGYVDEAREATRHAYRLLREGAPAAEALAQALPGSIERLYRVGHGAEAEAVAGSLLERLSPEESGDPQAFARGLRLGFAAGCLVQWRVLELLVGEEIPLWPVQRYSTDRQVD